MSSISIVNNNNNNNSNNNNNNRTFKMKQQLRNPLLENDELDYYHQNLIQSAATMTTPPPAVVGLPELVAEIQNSKHITMTKPSQPPQAQIDPSSIPTVLRRNASFDSCVLQKNERRVLVIYTGGTIGMVRSPRGALVPLPNMLEKTVRKFPHLHDEKYAKMRFGDTNEQPVVLPEMNDEKTRIIYTIYEYDPLLDSSNMTMDDWIRIAQDVKDNYEKFDGFVILHGTDTMAYTAPALSFMIDNLGKSVIITGSQIPLFETRSDGRDNFLGALILAGSYVIPEVTVYFGHRLFRGNRISKVSSDSLNAFDSPNLQPLATMGINIQVNYHNIFRPTEISPFTIRTSLNRNVGLLRLFPSITVETVRVFLQAPTLGVVLQTYGAGNFPTNRIDLLKELEDAAARGVLILNVTQCGHGSVSPIYETGHMIQKMGIIPGWDMTPEAALTKLSYVLGRSDWSLEKKREMLQTNLKGELTKCGNKLQQNYFPTSAPTPVIGVSYQSGKSAEFVVDCLPSSNYSYNGYGRNDVVVGPDVVQNVVRVVSSSLGLNSPEEQVGIKKLLTPSLSCALMTQVGHSNNNTVGSNNSFSYAIPIVQQDAPGPSSSALVPVVGSPNSKFLENLFGHSDSEICAGDYSGRTPLHFACSMGNLRVVEFLLKKGASVHVRDNRGFSPLREAVEFDQHDVIRMLRQCGAHLTLEPCTLGAELNLAASRGDITRLKSFLLAGADLNQVDPCGRAPIHAATEARNPQVIEWLLKSGDVDPHIKNKLGQSALDLAHVLEYTEVVKLFQCNNNVVQ